MIYLKLFFTFVKIGLFSFGGGYAMVPLIQKEIESNNWLTAKQFIDIIAVAETTPGPIAVNSATFVGFKVAGFYGSLVSTIGVSLPTFILVILLSKAVQKFSEHPVMKGILYGIRPVVISLILFSAIIIGKTVLFQHNSNNIDWISLVIGILAFIGIIRFKLHPILLITASGFLGIILY
ncbi:MAG: chromate transporter [Bacillota bacterium]